jgi:hypothetical protein
MHFLAEKENKIIMVNEQREQAKVPRRLCLLISDKRSEYIA